MINAHRERATALTENASRVTSICAIQQVVDNHKHVGSAALTFHHLNAILVLLDLTEGRLIGVETKGALDR